MGHSSVAKDSSRSKIVCFIIHRRHFVQGCVLCQESRLVTFLVLTEKLNGEKLLTLSFFICLSHCDTTSIVSHLSLFSLSLSLSLFPPPPLPPRFCSFCNLLTILLTLSCSFFCGFSTLGHCSFCKLSSTKSYSHNVYFTVQTLPHQRSDDSAMSGK